MQIPILIEQNAEHRFVATGSAPFTISAEAETADEAVALLKAKIEERVAHGATIATIEVQTSSNPWLAGAGMFEGDPLCKAWQDELVIGRRKENSVPEHS
jgi:predicted RNase H-like HicB family nuclease